MKLMKRILAIVCTFVMIISMATGVNAVETTTAATSEKGSITLENAVEGDEYKIYKILSLESYVKNTAYSYTKPGGVWDNFIDSNMDKFFVSNNEGYIDLKSKEDSEVRKLAIYAIGYAHANNVSADQTVIAEQVSRSEEPKVKFTNLDLGYYVVEATSGTACAITTTDPDATIKEKHSNPSVSKKIIGGGTIIKDGAQNSVNLGDVVEFQTTISVKPGAKNYILHDKMDIGLTFSHVHDVNLYLPKETDSKKQNPSIALDEYYTINRANDDGCTFELSFTPKFYSEYKEAIDNKSLTEIKVDYLATVDNSAPINTAMNNKTHLTYGDRNTATDESETKTYTYGIPVYKFTGTNTPLAGAKFILSEKENPSDSDAIKFTATGENYYYADQLSATATITLESHNSGYIYIKGLEAGAYYLKETEAPKGYNKITSPIKIVVEAGENGDPKITVGTDVVDTVKVQNNTGSLLPSTGGMGTTLIYVVGSILVLASGMVLFSKRKEGTN